MTQTVALTVPLRGGATLSLRDGRRLPVDFVKAAFTIEVNGKMHAIATGDFSGELLLTMTEEHLREMIGD